MPTSVTKLLLQSALFGAQVTGGRFGGPNLGKMGRALKCPIMLLNCYYNLHVLGSRRPEVGLGVKKLKKNDFKKMLIKFVNG